MAPTKLTEEKKEKIKERILEKAFHVFSNKGYYQTSIDDIVTKKFSKGTIYNYFGSKEELYLATMAEMRSRWSKLDQSPLFKGVSVKEKLEKLLTFLFQIYESIPLEDRRANFENIGTAFFHSNPAIIDSIRQDYKGFLKNIEWLIQEGIDSGEFKVDADIKLVSLLITSTLQGLNLFSSLLDEEIEWRKIGKVLVNCIYSEITS